jgi:hypothetical protein
VSLFRAATCPRKCVKATADTQLWLTTLPPRSPFPRVATRAREPRPHTRPPPPPYTVLNTKLSRRKAVTALNTTHRSPAAITRTYSSLAPTNTKAHRTERMHLISRAGRRVCGIDGRASQISVRLRGRAVPHAAHDGHVRSRGDRSARVLRHERPQPRLVGATHAVDHLAAAEEEEGGHRRHLCGDQRVPDASAVVRVRSGEHVPVFRPCARTPSCAAKSPRWSTSTLTKTAASPYSSERAA